MRISSTVSVFEEDEEGKGNELKEKIYETRDKFLALLKDKDDKAILEANMTLETADVPEDSEKTDWAEYTFYHMPAEAARTLLVKFKNDTIANLQDELVLLKEKHANLTAQYTTLSDNYKQLRANSSDEIKKLIKDLEAAQANLAAREKRLQEVEDAMKKRDDMVNSLRDKLAKALLGFNKSGLSVNIKDGFIINIGVNSRDDIVIQFQDEIQLESNKVDNLLASLCRY